MKILLLIEDLVQGGAERQMSYLARGLKEQGADVRLVTFYPNSNHYESYLIEAGIATECLKNGNNKFKRISSIISIVKSWKPDLVVSYLDGTSMAACLARSVVKFNLAVSERNTTQNLSLRERIKFSLYKFADHIISNSFSQRDFIIKNYPGLANKIKVITNMVDTSIFSPLPSPKQNPIPQIITTARVAPQKNVLNFLEAVYTLKSRNVKAKFNWYGRIDAESDYWDEIQAKIRELDIEEDISFHGPTKAPAEKYKESDLFILPSFYEGFPNSLCEAMACGLPVIASNVSDCPQILEDHRWLFNPTNSAELADRIREILCLSDDQKQQICNHNRQRIVELCSPGFFISNYLELL